MCDILVARRKKGKKDKKKRIEKELERGMKLRQEKRNVKKRGTRL